MLSRSNGLRPLKCRPRRGNGEATNVVIPLPHSLISGIGVSFSKSGLLPCGSSTSPSQHAASPSSFVQSFKTLPTVAFAWTSTFTVYEMPQGTDDHAVINATAPTPATSARPRADTVPADSLRSLCGDVAARVNAFLTEDLQTEILRAVQRQTREALEVIGDALRRYRYVGWKGIECLVELTQSSQS